MSKEELIKGLIKCSRNKNKEAAHIETLDPTKPISIKVNRNLITNAYRTSGNYWNDYRIGGDAI